MRGHAYYDADRRAVLFRSSDLIDLLKQRKIACTPNDVWAALSEAGCGRTQVRIQGIQVKLWAFPVNKGDEWFNIEQQAEKF
jgi:hypothetical protein